MLVLSKDYLLLFGRLLSRYISSGTEGNLFGGQRQKIGLLRALVTQPPILLLDEPENNLEKTSVTQLVDYLASIKGSTTVVLVSHSDDFTTLIDKRLEL